MNFDSETNGSQSTARHSSTVDTVGLSVWGIIQYSVLRDAGLVQMYHTKVEVRYKYGTSTVSLTLY